MSDRHDQIRKAQTITNGVMAGTSTISSLITSIQFLDNIGLEFVWSGSPVGNFQVLISADYDPNQNIAGNWVPLLFTYWNGSSFVTSYLLPTSLGSPYYLDLALLSAPWIQVTYTNISGSGTLNTFLTAKAI
jgi:hypothetical protein